MAYVKDPRSPAADLKTMMRKIQRVRKATVAISIARACYNRSVKARGCGQCLHPDWLTATLAAIDRARALIRVEHPFFHDTMKDLDAQPTT